jgi:hypothetical protein
MFLGLPDTDPLVRSMDPGALVRGTDPHLNVTGPQHWLPVPGTSSFSFLNVCSFFFCTVRLPCNFLATPHFVLADGLKMKSLPTSVRENLHKSLSERAYECLVCNRVSSIYNSSYFVSNSCMAVAPTARLPKDLDF